jgi:hypothetical protein
MVTDRFEKFARASGATLVVWSCSGYFSFPFILVPCWVVNIARASGGALCVFTCPKFLSGSDCWLQRCWGQLFYCPASRGDGRGPQLPHPCCLTISLIAVGLFRINFHQNIHTSVHMLLVIFFITHVCARLCIDFSLWRCRRRLSFPLCYHSAKCFEMPLFRCKTFMIAQSLKCQSALLTSKVDEDMPSRGSASIREEIF